MTEWPSCSSFSLLFYVTHTLSPRVQLSVKIAVIKDTCKAHGMNVLGKPASNTQAADVLIRTMTVLIGIIPFKPTLLIPRE